MTIKKKKPTEFIEHEFSKQINEMDKHIDRGGMISLILIVVSLFIIGYWIIDFFSISHSPVPVQYEAEHEIVERIEQLESRIEMLEQKE